MTTSTAVLLLLAAWAGAVVGSRAGALVHGSPAVLLAVPVAFLPLAVGIATTGRRAGRRPGARAGARMGVSSADSVAHRCPGRALAAVAAVTVALTTAGGAAVRAAAVDHGPLVEHLDEDRPVVAVVLVATAVGDVRAGDGGDTVVLRLSAVEVAGRPAVARSRERVLVRLPTTDRPADLGADGAGSTGPAAGAAVRHGGVYRIRGVASRLDGPSAPAFRRIGVVVAVDAVALELVRGPPALHRAATALRLRVRAAAHRHLPPAHASLLTGLVTGDLTGQPSEVETAVEHAGLAHLVAVSGSNVALLAGAVMAIVLGAGLGRRPAWWAALAATWWLVLVVRAEPSVVRAAATATLVLVAMLVGRRRSTAAVLATAGTLVLLVDPALATRLGFALSVAATAGVVGIAPPLRRRLDQTAPRLPPGVRSVLAATAGAQLAVAPLLLAVGGAAHPASLPANLLAVPAAAAASAVGSATALLATVAPGAAAALAVLARPALAIVLRTADAFADGPARRAAAVAAVVALLVGGLLVLRVAWGSWRRASGRSAARTGWRPGRLVAPLAVVAIASAAVLPTAGGGATDLPAVPQLVVLDVGQGDAVLLGDPGGGWVLVDGGPDPDRLRAALDRHGVDALAAVVASHPHADHVDGLLGVLGHLDVGALVIGPTGRRAAELLAAAEGAGVPVVEVAAGAGWAHGSARLQVLGPPRTGVGEEPNDNSLVLRADVGGIAALLTGDVEVVGQVLLRDHALLDVDVLKVPHHGGDTNLAGFLRSTSPSTAVISVGADNPFGHPHPDVLAELAGVEVRRTDEDGDVRIPLTASR